MRPTMAEPRLLWILAALALGLPSLGLAQESTPLEGAWVVTSWTVEGETSEARPGLFVFTRTHYSIMFVPGTEAREPYSGESLTDADMVAAYATIIANSGRYEVNGDEFTTRAYVAKDPNYMGSFPENEVTYGFRIEGDTLYVTFGNGWEATFRQVDDQPFGG